MERVVTLLRPDVPYQRECPRDLLRERVEGMGAQLEIVSHPDQLAEALAEADIYMGSLMTASLLEKARKLRWIHAPLAGVDRLLIPELVQSDIVVTNSKGTMAPEVAEHALALALALTRDLDLAVRGQMARQWWDVRAMRRPLSVVGLTLGIVGYGAIGQELARRAQALGMEVVAVRRSARGAGGEGDAWVSRVEPPQRLKEVLSISDVVVLAVPLVEETRGLIGAEELAAMKPTAYLINVSRGAVVDEEALLEALKKGTIAGAASDVFSQEPLPPESPLWDAPNFLITPHVAGSSQHYWPRIFDLFCENLQRWRQGLPLKNEVNKALGY